MTQYALPLPVRAAYGRQDFFVSPANAEAVAWVDRWPDWPASTLALFGPKGCGKSHLCAVHAAKGAHAISYQQLRAGLDPLTLPLHLVLDDDRVPPDVEPALFHLINWSRERGGSLLIAARTPAGQWPVAIPDLRSRLAAMAAVAIDRPDDALLGALMVKMFADRQVAVEPRLIEFVLARCDRSFAGVAGLVARLDHAALMAGGPVSVKLARRLLAEGDEMA